MFVKPSNPFPHFRSKSLNVKSSFMVKNEIKDNVPLKKKNYLTYIELKLV